MDDLEGKLDRLLSSPDGLKKVEELMAAFGASPSSPPSASEIPPSPSLSLDGLPDMAQLMKLLPLVQQLQRPDDNAALLSALRPYLQDERQQRLDDAQKMLRLWRMMPLLKEFGKGEAHEE